MAREYYEQGHIRASFFFSRGSGDISRAGKFFTSMAVQLADKSPSLKRHIYEAIAEHSEISSQTLRNQWRQLILQPLLKPDSDFPHPSLLIVVDVLDECEGENDIRIIVQLFTKAQLLRRVRLRVFITSRPEIPIISQYQYLHIIAEFPLLKQYLRERTITGGGWGRKCSGGMVKKEYYGTVEA